MGYGGVICNDITETPFIRCAWAFHSALCVAVCVYFRTCSMNVDTLHSSTPPRYGSGEVYLLIALTLPLWSHIMSLVINTTIQQETSVYGMGGCVCVPSFYCMGKKLMTSICTNNLIISLTIVLMEYTTLLLSPGGGMSIFWIVYLSNFVSTS